LSHSKKDLILQTAGQLFAKQGFNGTAMRQIAEKAGVPISLAYYYFPGKEHLYRACVHYVIHSKIFTRELLNAIEHQVQYRPGKDYQQEIHHIMQTIFLRFLSPSHPPWHSEIVSRVLMEKNAPSEQAYRESILPLYHYFSQLVKRIYPFLKKAQIEFFIITYFGLIHHFVSARTSICRIVEIDDYTRPFLDEAFEHIARASLSVLQEDS